MFRSDLLKDKRVLITGGGTGRGHSMASRFLSLGADVVIASRREEGLKEACTAWERDFPGQSHWQQLDIRDPEMVTAVLDRVWQEGPLDILVNNAAGNFLAQSETLSHRAFDAVVGIVLHGSTYMTLDVGKRWIAEGRGGCVLSILTAYAWTGSAYVVPSAVGKAGVLALTRSLAVEWGPKGIRLNAIAPGPFPTEGAWERLVPNERLEKAWLDKIPLGRVGRHEELADLASFMVSDQAGYMNGELVHLDGGEWLGGAGQFNIMRDLSPEEWAAMTARGRGK